MTVALIYLFLAIGEFLASSGAYRPDMTRILLAFGIVGICYRLDDIKKGLGDKHG